MDENPSVGNKAKEFIMKNPVFVGVVLLGLLLCLFGGYQYIQTQNNSSELLLITDDIPEERRNNITVDVQGEVVNPNVYTLSSDARVKDAIDAAGGLAEGADEEYISRNINMAQQISDGTKIYIPAVGEMEANASVIGANDAIKPVDQGLSLENSGLVNINSADIAALDTLPRVGPVTAQKIVDGRPYGTIEELVSKKVVGQKTFDGLKDRITVQ